MLRTATRRVRGIQKRPKHNSDEWPSPGRQVSRFGIASEGDPCTVWPLSALRRAPNFRCVFSIAFRPWLRTAFRHAYLHGGRCRRIEAKSGSGRVGRSGPGSPNAIGRDLRYSALNLAMSSAASASERRSCKPVRRTGAARKSRSCWWRPAGDCSNVYWFDPSFSISPSCVFTLSASSASGASLR
jgi:hypothetical protein